MFRLGNQNTTFGDTLSVKTTDGPNQGGTHAEIAGKRKVENGSVGQARESTDEQLEHLVGKRLESHDSHEV
jgi:hypothetical protein